MFDLTPADYQFVARVLNVHGLLDDAWVFGSRADGTAQRYSDLDLLIRSPKPLAQTKYQQLRTWFAESRLPFKVDLSDWQQLTPEFQTAIAPTLVKFRAKLGDN